MTPEQIREAHDFYQANYENIILHFGPGLVPHRIGDKTNRHCRFCKKGEPDVPFLKDAHALPESIGNRSIVSYYECDHCNDSFGKDIEHHFGSWSAFQRTFGLVQGRKGIPKIIKDKAGWSVVADNAGMKVFGQDYQNLMKIDELNKKAVLKVPRDPYIPMAVLKAFHKMALSVMPDEHISTFHESIDWICNPDHTVPLNGLMPEIACTFVPAIAAFRKPFALLLRRFTDDLNLPYMTFVVAFGSYVYQVFLASPLDLQNREFTGKFFPVPDGPGKPSISKFYSLAGCDMVRDDYEEVTFDFETVIKTSTPAPVAKP